MRLTGTHLSTHLGLNYYLQNIYDKLGFSALKNTPVATVKVDFFIYFFGLAFWSLNSQKNFSCFNIQLMSTKTHKKM